MLTIDRSRFVQLLKEHNIGASVHFIPLHLHPFYQRAYGYEPGNFPNAEWVYERYISLPIYPGMSDQDVSGRGGSGARDSCAAPALTWRPGSSISWHP